MFTGRVERRSTGVLEKALRVVADAKRREVAVGLPKSKASGSVIDIAIYNEFGTRRIPPRPAIGNAMRDNWGKYASAMKASASKLLTGTTSIDAVLTKLGILAQGHIQGEIVALRSPANAASTIRQKGSSNPLIDTGEMRQGVTWHVRSK